MGPIKQLRHVGVAAAQGMSSHLTEYDLENFFGDSSPGELPDLDDLVSSLDSTAFDPKRFQISIQICRCVVDCSHLIIDKLTGRELCPFFILLFFCQRECR
jgi:hypothetical protein